MDGHECGSKTAHMYGFCAAFQPLKGPILAPERHVFTQKEVEILKNNGIIGVEAKHVYTRSELNEKGIPGDTAIAIRETLNAWGITVNQTCY